MYLGTILLHMDEYVTIYEAIEEVMVIRVVNCHVNPM